MLFTISHVGLMSGDPKPKIVAGQLAAFMENYLKSPGLYRNHVNRDGSVTGNLADEVARSYDLSFVVLGLVTWNKLWPSDDTATLIDDCWNALQSEFLDPTSGLLRNDDTGEPSNPAQNPHMHFYEACLQAHQMCGDNIWLSRAAEFRTTSLRYFMNESSGSIAEFLTPDLQPLPGADGQRREIGHQCEWAWLLREEARLCAQNDLLTPSDELSKFADRFGFAHDGPLAGAVVDAVTADGVVVENTYLLWPQTEAIKLLAVRHAAGDTTAGIRAQTLMCLMFERWFEGRPTFVNQLDKNGATIWPQALTRLMYHIVLAMTEGAKAGLWPNPSYVVTDPTL